MLYQLPTVVLLPLATVVGGLWQETEPYLSTHFHLARANAFAPLDEEDRDACNVARLARSADCSREVLTPNPVSDPFLQHVAT